MAIYVSNGLYFGLKENSYVDERMDPEKATDAACRYLKKLFGIYGDWNLALAAYNAGPGNVNKAIRRSGNKKRIGRSGLIFLKRQEAMCQILSLQHI